MTPSRLSPDDGAAEPLLQTPSGAKVHVLIADDNDTNRKVMAAMCELFDCATFLTRDGVSAVAAFSASTFDIVLMDIDMPRMNGIDATLAIRASGEAGRCVPIIAVTASVEPHDLAKYRDVGMNGVVPKPIEASRLLEAISIAIGGAQES